MAIKAMKCGHCGELSDNPDKHTCPQSKPDYPEDFIDALRFKAALDQYGIEEDEVKAFFSPQYIAKYVLDLRKRVLSLENFIGQNYPQDISALKGFYGEFGHRLKIIEDLFEGKSFKPIHDAMETHVEMFAERIELLESNFGLRSKDIFNLMERLTEIQDTCVHNNGVLCKDMNKFEKDLKNKDSDLWERVKRLEEAKPSNDGINILINGLDNMSQKMPRLEKENEHHCEAISALEDSHKSIKQLIQNLIEQNQKKYASLEDELKAKLIAPMCDVSREVFSKMYPNVSQTESYVMPSKGKPHKCPVCEGTRTCHSKDSGLSWQCESCEGKGIIWG